MEDRDFEAFEEVKAEEKAETAEDKAEEETAPAEEEAAPVSVKKEKKSRQKRGKRRSWAFPLGVLMLVLSVIGVATIISSVTGMIKERTDNTQELEYYNEYLTWVVANDPDSFDDISKANSTQLLDISILSLLYDDLNTSDYELTDEGLAVPAADVEKYYDNLFGTEKAIVHGTVSGVGYTFKYDETNGVYYVPLTGVTPPFTPRVVSVNKSRGAIVLKVGYIGTSKLSVAADGSITGAEPDKYMNITLRKTGGEFRIYSIQSANPPETGE